MGGQLSKSKSSHARRHISRQDSFTAIEDHPTQSIHDEAVNCVYPVSDGVCVSGGKDNVVAMYDFDNKETVHRWIRHGKEVTKVVYGQHIGKVASASRDKTIKLWQRGHTGPICSLEGHDLVVTALAISPDNRNLLSGSRDNSVRVWDIESGQCTLENLITRNLVTDLCWSKTGNIVVQTSEDKEVRVWDPKTLTVAVHFPRKQYIQTSCDVTSDGNYCVTGSNGFGGHGCEATLWDIRTGKLLKEFKGHDESIGACRFLSEMDLIVTAGNDCTVRVWDVASAECITSEILGGSGPCTGIAINSDNRLVVSTFSAGLQLLKIDASTNPTNIKTLFQF